MVSKPASANTQSRKPIFDAFRTILGRGFRQREVEAIDQALDGAGHTPATVSPTFRSPWAKHQVSAQGAGLIKQFEGCARLRTDGLIEAYPDPGTGSDPWTIGWGATGNDLDGTSRIGPGTVWTQQQADMRLSLDLVKYANEVSRAIGKAPTSQGQFDAMVSFHYNTGAIARATLTKRHIAGDFAGASHEFQRWNKAGGRVLKGLIRRRLAEARLYASG